MVDIAYVLSIIAQLFLPDAVLDRLMQIGEGIVDSILEDFKGSSSLLFLTVHIVLSSHLLYYHHQRLVVFHN